MSDISPLIRLFVSSTFADFGLERDVLQRMVFPRLRQLCEAQGCRFQPIDLRWGVSEEAGNEKRTLTICFEEIRRCQQVSPDLNFLILLGDRYGSCFLSATIPSTQVARLLPHLNTEERDIFRDAYREDLNALPPEYVLLPNTAGGRNDEQLRMALGRAARAAGFSPDEVLPFMASATHLEIQRGLLAAGADPAAVVCALRSFTSTPAGNDASGYVEQDSARSAQVESLKHAVEERLEGRLQRYVVPWGANGPVFDRETLARLLLDLLEPRVREALARRQAAVQTRDPVGEANSQFAAARASVLFGRKDALATVATYLSDQLPLPLVVTGASGVGKSSLLARAAEDATRTHPNAVVVTRYIGVTPGTGSLFDLLSSLRGEIAQRYGQTVPEPQGDLSQVVEAVATQLGTLEISAERPLFLVIDALDQLGVKRQRLDWLPRTLAPNVRVVLSILSDRPELAILRAWMPQGQELELDPLSRAQGAAVLRAWLLNEGRQLIPDQEEAVLDGFAPAPQVRGTPLYLRLAFEQARTWRSFDVKGPPPPTVPALIQAYFDKLEELGQHGRELVAFALGHVAAAKHGLAEDELLDILPRNKTVRDALDDLNPEAPSINEQQPLPVVLWARLHADLDRYLTEREADGARLVTFYHRQVREEAERRYLGDADRMARHTELATYFAKQPYRLHDGTTWVWNRRKLAELAYQQAEAGAEDNEALKTTLTNVRFLEGKLTVEGVLATLDDLARVTTAPKDTDIEKIDRAIRAGAIVLAKAPSEVVNQIHGRVGKTVHLHEADTRSDEQDEDNMQAMPRMQLRSQSLDADPSLLFILQGHSNDVTGCALSADGTRALSSSKDGTLRLWDVDKGETLLILQDGVGPVDGCALSANGRRALSVSRQRMLRLWDTETGVLLRTLESDRGGTGCALSGDGQQILYVARDRTLQFWDTTRDRSIRLKGHTGEISSCALSMDGNRALSASKDRTLRVWDTESGKTIRTLRGLMGAVDACALSGDGRWALSVSNNPIVGYLGRSTLRVWDTKSGRTRRILEGHNGHIVSCALSADGTRALSASGGSMLGLLIGGSGWSPASLPGLRGYYDFEDSTLRVWDTTSGKTLHTLQGHKDAAFYCALSGNGARALSASSDDVSISDIADDHKSLRLWNTKDGEALQTSESHTRTVVGCAMSADGRFALSASADRTLRVWDTYSGLAVQVLKGHRGVVLSCALSWDGRVAFSLSEDQTLRLWDTASGRLRRARKCHHLFPGAGCALSADGSLALSPGDWPMELWDTMSGQRRIRLFDDWISKRGSPFETILLRGFNQFRGCGLSANGRRALVATVDGTLHVWDLPSDTKGVRSLHGSEFRLSKVSHCALSADGLVLLAVSEDGKLRCWDVESLKMRFESQPGKVNDCALSANGQLMLAACADGTLRLCDTARGHEIVHWTHDVDLQCCALSANGRILIAGDIEGGVHILDVVGAAREQVPY